MRTPRKAGASAVERGTNFVDYRRTQTLCSLEARQCDVDVTRGALKPALRTRIARDLVHVARGLPQGLPPGLPQR
jgi:hypothetical protein